MPTTISGLTALERNSPLTTFTFERRDPRPHDVAFDVLYCGLCHSDLHSIGEWGQAFPLVPGHEMVGRVTAIGDAVEGFSPGDIVAVSVIVDSCRHCDPCERELETYCLEGPTSTYDGIDRVSGERTRGGYSQAYVADERFVHHVPEGLDLAAVAPLLCAGLTTWSPLRHWNVGFGMTVGVIGIGGLGHLGLKFARALGAHVVAFTTSPDKAEDALRLGAHEAIVSSDEALMAAQANRFDFLLDTVSTSYPMDPFVRALKLDGALCSLGIPNEFNVTPVMLAMGRRSIASSGAGGTRDVREMLEFCAKHSIVSEIELVENDPDAVNSALDRLARNDVRYRFVIDMGLVRA